MRLRQLALKSLLLAIQSLKVISQGTWQVFLFITKPSQWLAKGVFKIIILPIYSLSFKIKFRVIDLFQRRNSWPAKVNSFSALILFCLLLIFSLWQSVQAADIWPEDFGKNNIIYTLTRHDDDLLDNENIIEGPLDPKSLTWQQEELHPDALSEEDLNINQDFPLSVDELSALTPDASALEALELPIISLASAKRTSIAIYEVQTGDTLSGISNKFDLHLSTILWTNNLTAYSMIKPGQKLKILPVDGLLYVVKKGDTLDKIAKTYQSNIDKILEFNRLQSIEQIAIAQELIIPGGIKPTVYMPPSTSRSIANVFTTPSKTRKGAESGGRFIWPTSVRRITQYFRYRHPGLDIGNRVGEPIYAAESGKVEVAGWNRGGYGNYVIINHGNGIKTLYAHASKLYVRPGQTVARGEAIAAIGSTGRSTGPHLHFEVRTDNVRQNPLLYVK
ncbi:MAG: hypothetical protein COX77_04105 [Candidatus Komeilibacteria bacterium CG_4_10_14_0_2_um_filter_37_10]|uniref:LysM domain-containing protein n=1 Tax=Candidatus Komeilibacteria bacterium CG_4_10_14_0_2_um_filter_37_10 TaxID=1974470 RepID=A0A2M7VDT5_9BACT|nr:MAG: hypothetical protein COX77_04105 [Candidatus Komeilibacteria bacterium CG_4_10_14_0_2_um_filter_37_10]